MTAAAPSIREHLDTLDRDTLLDLLADQVAFDWQLRRRLFAQLERDARRAQPLPGSRQRRTCAELTAEFVEVVRRIDDAKSDIWTEAHDQAVAEGCNWREAGERASGQPLPAEMRARVDELLAAASHLEPAETLHVLARAAGEIRSLEWDRIPFLTGHLQAELHDEFEALLLRAELTDEEIVAVVLERIEHDTCWSRTELIARLGELLGNDLIERAASLARERVLADGGWEKWCGLHNWLKARAEACGDTDELVELLSVGGGYEAIRDAADTLAAAGRPRDALKMLERHVPQGVKREEAWERRRIRWLYADGETERAFSRAQHWFFERPNMHRIHPLEEVARACGRWREIEARVVAALAW